MAVLRRKEYHVESNGIGGNAFAVKASSKMFETLMSTLYRHKEEATARELGCNANDAHKERNRMYRPLVSGYHQSVYAASFRASERRDTTWFAPAEKQWELHVPSTIEPYLEVKDFGVGLTVDQIMGLEWYVDADGNTFQMDDEWVGQVDDNGQPVGATYHLDAEGRVQRSGGMYTTLFDSTKENDNDQTGAFGLGSKSPFSIADSFTVESRVGGEKHMYLMYMNAKRIPQVDWITKDKGGFSAPLPTDEFNGVTVKVTVQADKCYTMRNACERILKPFEHQPVVSGYPIEVKPVDRERLIGQTYMQPDTNVHYAVTGDVAYPIEIDRLDPDIRAVFKKLRRGSYTFFPLGELNVPPSREDLSYDEFTMEALNRRLAYASGAVEEQIRTEFEGIKSMYDMMNKYKELLDVWGSDLLGGVKLKGRDGRQLTLTKDMKVEIPKYKSGDNELSMFSMRMFEVSYDGEKLVKSEYETDSMPVSHMRNSIIMYLDNSRMYLKKSLHVIDELKEEGRGIARVYMVTPKPEAMMPKDTAKVDPKFVSAVFEHEVPVFLSSKVTPPKAKYGGGTSSGVSMYNWGTSCSFHSWDKVTPEHLNEDILASEKPWLYVEMTGFNPQGMNMDAIQNTERFMNRINREDRPWRGIIGVRKSAMKIVNENPDMFVPIVGAQAAYVKAQLNDNLTPQETRYLVAMHTKDWIEDNYQEMNNLRHWCAIFAPEKIPHFHIFSSRKGVIKRWGDHVKLMERINANKTPIGEQKWRLLKDVKCREDKYPWLNRITDHFDRIEKDIIALYPDVMGERRYRPTNCDASDTAEVMNRIHLKEFMKEHGYKKGGMWLNMSVPSTCGKGKSPVDKSMAFLADYLEDLDKLHNPQPEPVPEIEEPEDGDYTLVTPDESDVNGQVYHSVCQ